MADTVAPQEAQILYLEPDDEITSVVRRLRDADAGRVVLVAPGRTKATTSAIGLRLLQREARDSGRDIALVADPAARALAAEAGIAAFASVAEAQSGMPADPGTSTLAPARASIHVVRGERLATPAIAASPNGLAEFAPGGAGSPPAAQDRRMDDTQAVPVVVPPAVPRARRTAIVRRPRMATRTAVAAGAVAVLVIAAVVAAVVPAASVRLTPRVTAIGPLSYTVTVAGSRDSGTLNSTMPGAATGTYDDSTPAHGTVVLVNYSNDRINVPKGSKVAAGDQTYTTDADLLVPDSSFLFGPGTASVPVTAAQPGEGGNVPAHAIDTVVDKALARRFKGSATRRIVDNPEPMTGGVTKTGPQVTQKDVDAVVTRITTDLQNQLTARMMSNRDRLYAAPASAQDPVITVPSGLVGTKDQDSFNLSGTLEYDRRYVTRDELLQAGREMITSDASSHAAGTSVVDSSVAVEPRALTTTTDQVRAEVTVRAAVIRTVDLEQLKASIEGKSRTDAVRALASVGAAHVDFWPGWVDAVPRLGFRIDMAIDVPDASSSATPSEAP